MVLVKLSPASICTDVLSLALIVCLANVAGNADCQFQALMRPVVLGGNPVGLPVPRHSREYASNLPEAIRIPMGKGIAGKVFEDHDMVPPDTYANAA